VLEQLAGHRETMICGGLVHCVVMVKGATVGMALVAHQAETLSYLARHPRHTRPYTILVVPRLGVGNADAALAIGMFLLLLTV
jgi:hypothetical protein